MALPVLTTGITNSVAFGSYSNALDYLSQSQRSDRNQGKPVSTAQIYTAGCFAGLVQVRTPDVHWLASSTAPVQIQTATINRLVVD